MIKEKWKDVVGYEDLFVVSDHGRVWSKRSDKILKQSTSKTGYKCISTRIGGRKGTCKCFKVHRLVAEAFIDNPDNKPYVNHLDCDKTNNHHTNLEWCTSSENMKHAYNNIEFNIPRGSERKFSKLTDGDIRYIRQNYVPRKQGFSQRALAKKFSVSKCTVERILDNRRWKHVE